MQKIILLITTLWVGICTPVKHTQKESIHHDTLAVSIAPPKIPTRCDSLRLDIATQWKYIEDEKYFKADPAFLNAILTVPYESISKRRYAKCLKGMSKDEFIALFGKPSRTQAKPTLLMYHLSASCIHLYDRNWTRMKSCYRILVALDSNDSVTSIKFATLSAQP
jgi:hypothetical protein